MIGRNRVQAVSEAATLQYVNGKSVACTTLGSGRFAPYVGFHIEVGKDVELDEALPLGPGEEQEWGQKRHVGFLQATSHFSAQWV